jgi:hypothetical protein
LFVCLFCLIVVHLFNWFIDWCLTWWLIDCAIVQLTDWLRDCAIDLWLDDWLIARLMTDWLREQTKQTNKINKQT